VSGAGGDPLTLADAAAIAKLPDVVSTSGSVRGGAQVIAAGANWQTSVEGVETGYFEANDWGVSAGRVFDEREVRTQRKVALLGATVATELFGASDPIGQKVRVNATTVEVIGILAKKGQSGFGQDRDDTVILPITVAQSRVLGRGGVRADGVQRIYVEGAAGGSRLSALQESVEALLRERKRVREGEESGFAVRNLTEFAQAQAQTSQLFTVLLLSVGGVSLLVGGIGIMNIMLVSVTERTREIGLRIALGARRGEVRAQFALEATVLSLAGGILGVVLGVTGSFILAKALGFPVVIDPFGVGIAFGVSALVGLIFGFWPASRASALDPIEALRRE
ncbi:MAG: ABC transporter permease, partial [Hyphomonadaceae bacterium]|nr:ABC transporter permease [Hyphomonadaceae bacterium]